MKLERIIELLIPTLFEDDDLLAIDKPAGVSTGGSERGSDPGLAEIVADVRKRGETLTPINRLGRFESGILLLAKHVDGAQPIRVALRTGRIRQDYTAIVTGKTSATRMTIGGQHGASRGSKKGKRQPAGKHRRDGEPELATSLEIVRRDGRRALVRCRTSIPTTHAFRAQLRASGLRIVGDTLNDRSYRLAKPEQTRLHLSRMTFRYAGKKAPLSLTTKTRLDVGDSLTERRDVGRLLRAALTRRLPCFANTATDSFRMVSGESDQAAGLVAETFGGVLVLQVHDDRKWPDHDLIQIAQWFEKNLGVRSTYLKRFVKDRSSVDERAITAMSDATPLWGKPAAEVVEIREQHLRFGIHPYDGFAVGLFLDQRDNRRRIRELALNKNVLNLFAYTCGFSVAAAVGGAKRCVSVDMSRKYLDWGRANFALNGLDASEHDFVETDALDYLRRAKRQGRRFDLAVVDPPTFAHGRKRGSSFSIARDLPELIGAAAGVVESGGHLLLSTNYRRLTATDLRDAVRKGAGRGAKIIESPPPPGDFRGAAGSARTVIVRFA